MKRSACEITAIFFITVFILSLISARAFAEHAEYKAIKELEQMAKTPPPPPQEFILRPNIEYNAEGLKDPFRQPALEVNKPTVAAEETQEPEIILEQPPALKIQGIIWGGRLNQAIVNNKVVKEQDTIEGAKIISINKKGITVLFKGKEYDIAASKRSDNSEP
jgi:hypothetical protein